MTADWDFLLLSYLHDPPGKALDIRGHEGRASALAEIALGHSVERKDLHQDTRTGDIFASTIERVVPLPTAGENGERAVGPEDGSLRLIHPLSGKALSIPVTGLGDTADEKETLKTLVAGLDPERARALAVWRLWRERLGRRNPAWGLMPADTRLPDHTIWNHLDHAMGCAASTGQGGIALLTFALGPVQPFIAAARTLRDLWAGSYLLAWLTFAAMKPVLEACGPAAILSPALRGNPFLDRWLRGLEFPESPGNPLLLASVVDGPEDALQLSACLPNRFTAFVPWGRDGDTARDLARRCESACREEWREIGDAVRRTFNGCLRSQAVRHADGWDRLWEDQTGSAFEVRTAVLPLNDCDDPTLGELLSPTGALADAFPDAFAVRALADAMPASHRPGYKQDSAGRWMGQIDLLGRLLAAQRALRPLPAYDPPADDQGRWPGKCSLLGTYEQLGPAGLEESPTFWDDAVEHARVESARLRPGERLCAVSLVKRYAWAAYFSQKLGLSRDALRYPDTATVAATLWLQENDIHPAHWEDWSGQWLHQQQQDKDKTEGEREVPNSLWQNILRARRENPVPAYYAVLMLDGDHMGKWLRGVFAPTVEQSLHPKLVQYFRGLSGSEGPLAARRPFGPALHAALSDALTNFALHFVPPIVKAYDGELIYAGGDDVLALLPTRRALACAAQLNETFRQDWAPDATGQQRLLMGNRATTSVGIAVAHYKEDLRAVLQAAREAEKQAKNSGRNALCLRIVRRSGEDSSAVVGWEQVGDLQTLVDAFVGGMSDRWAYRLRAELPTLRDHVPEAAFAAETSRLLDRLEGDPERRKEFCKHVLAFWAGYHARFADRPTTREGFVTLCQSASFLARGRDQ